jgi:uncharacterized membrane protein HdeD (DUF308 family)
MKDFLKKIKWDSIIVSILTIAIGVLCIVMPSEAGDVLLIIFGAVLIAIGATLFVRFFTADKLFANHIMIMSVVSLVLGIMCLVQRNSLQSILTILLGLYIVVDSLSSIGDSIYLLKAKVSGWFVLFLLSLLSCGLGVVVMFSTFDTVMIFAGISLLIEGVKRFVFTLTFSNKIRSARKQFEKGLQDVIEIEEE